MKRGTARSEGIDPTGLVCPRCGATAWRVERPPFFEGVWAWLTMGRSWRSRVHVCRSCGYRLGGGSVATYGMLSIRRLPAPVRALTTPWRVLRVLMGRRSATPNPLLYLMAGAAGLAIGLALALVFGWTWWSVLLAGGIALLVAFAVFLATAFGHTGGMPGHDLRTDVLRTISPKRAQAREDRIQAELFADPPFALYGLPDSWAGPRLVGGMASSDRSRAGVTSMELLHGDPGTYADAPTLRVGSSRDAERDIEFQKRSLEHRLSDLVSRPPRDATGAETLIWLERQRAERRARPRPRWTTVRIPVDGAPIAFDLIMEENCWVAAAHVGDVAVSIVAVSWPLDGLELVRIPDASAYVEGSRRRDERLRREHHERRDGPT